MGAVYAYAFDPNTNKKIEIHFWQLPESAVEIDFMVDESYNLTNKGDQFTVFATVVNAIKEYDERYAPKYLIFSAKEANRKSLYTQMVKRLAPTVGYTIGNIDNLPEEVHNSISLNPSDFVLIHQGAEVDEGVVDWAKKGAAAGAIALGALGAGQADAKPIQPPLKPAIQQPIQRDTTPGHNVLSNNPHNEIVMLKTAKASGMKGAELAQFMAQTKHESWDFDRLKEKPQPGVKGYFSKKYDPKFAPRTAKILGNKHVGDGERYHGRGFIQLTGRDNYRMASDALGIDLLNKPELAARPDIAAKVAVWYWNTRVKPGIKNFADTKAVTQKINPAARGLENRHENFKDYMRII
jgi:predicted chitinase